MLRSIALGAFLWLALASSTQAQYLVDTGTPSDNGGYSLGDIQSVGASFTLASAANITSVEIFLRTTRGGQVFDSDLTVSLYAGDPGGTVLFEKSLDIVASTGWFVVDGLSWQVAAGPYTVAFASSQTGNILGAGIDAPDPLPLWVLNPPATDWVLEPDAAGFGVRIGGQPLAAVPEPESSALLVAGLALLVNAARTRRRRAKAARAS
jgi:hypothetical protein